MGIDLQEGYDSIGSSIQKNQKYKQLSNDYKRLKKKYGDAFEKNKKETTSRYNEQKKKFDKWKQKQSNQLDELLKIKFLSANDQFGEV